MDESLKPPEDIPAVSAEDLVDGEPAEEEGRRYPSTIGGLLYLLVLAVALTGLVLVVLWSWRPGVRIVGGAMIAAALCRLMLRERDAGMLAVRNRWLDSLILAGMGTAMIVLTTTIPNQPGVGA